MAVHCPTKYALFKERVTVCSKGPRRQYSEVTLDIVPWLVLVTRDYHGVGSSTNKDGLLYFSVHGRYSSELRWNHVNKLAGQLSSIV